MCTYIYIYIYVHTYIHTYTHIHVYIYLYMHTYTYIDACVFLAREAGADTQTEASFRPAQPEYCCYYYY